MKDRQTLLLCRVGKKLVGRLWLFVSLNYHTTTVGRNCLSAACRERTSSWCAFFLLLAFERTTEFACAERQGNNNKGTHPKMKVHIHFIVIVNIICSEREKRRRRRGGRRADTGGLKEARDNTTQRRRSTYCYCACTCLSLFHNYGV